MPLDPGRVAAELESEVEGIREYLREDATAPETYREVTDEQRDRSADAIREALSKHAYPGALPTEEWDRHDGLTVPFEPIADWDSHQAVNRWAQDVLTGVTTVATDGSESGPTTEFNVPLALVQSVWWANHHEPDGAYDQGAREDVLAPQELLRKEQDGDVTYVDGRQVSHARYEHEAATVVDRIEAYADREPAPIVIYDGPLVVSFANAFRGATRQRYLDAMSEILAASKRHEVPVVGYVAGTSANELAKMFRLLDPETLGTESLVPDQRLLEPLMSPWGDRSIAFQSRRDGSIDALETTYHGLEYRFGDDLLFVYLDAPGLGALDRLEFPRWVLETGALDRVVNVVRAEAAVGRGYPEILQQADADVVLTQDDYDRFLRIVQQFAEEHDIPIDWDSKALSKTKRRR